MAHLKAMWTPRFRQAGVTTALLLLAALVVIHGLAYGMLVDDAFIAFRYAGNLSRGLGLVFNQGERVEGYTDFLWVVLLAGVKTLGASIPVASQVLGAACAALVIPVSYRAGRRGFDLPPGVALLPGVIVASSAATAMWTGAGLETALYMALFTAALGRALEDLAAAPRVPVSGLLFGLAALTRPEALGLFLVLGVSAAGLRPGRAKTLLGMAAGFGLVFVPHLLFRLAYYGYPFPNTFYAKTALTASMWGQGLDYLGGFLLAHGPWALPFLLGLFLGASPQERWQALIALLVLGAAAGYIVAVGGDFYPYWRFAVPYLPWLALLTCAGAWRTGRWLERRLVRGRGLGALVLLLVAGSAAVAVKVWPDAVYLEKVQAARPTAALLESYGRWFRKNRPPDTLLAISTIGRVAYYSRLRIVDMLGITDAHIAHGKMDLTYGTVGHQRYDSEYVLSRKPDIVALELGQHILGFDPNEVNTEKIYRQIQPGEAWFPAPADLIGRRAFRLDYAPRVAEVEPDKYFVFFERDPTLRETIARVPLESSEPKAHFALGMRLRKHGLLDDAVTRMRLAASLDPRRGLAPALNAAYFLLEAGRPEEALTEFRALAARAPEEPLVRYGAALVLHRLERYREAIPAWKRYLAIARNPRFTRKAQQMLAEAERRAVNE